MKSILFSLLNLALIALLCWWGYIMERPVHIYAEKLSSFVVWDHPELSSIDIRVESLDEFKVYGGELTMRDSVADIHTLDLNDRLVKKTNYRLACPAEWKSYLGAWGVVDSFLYIETRFYDGFNCIYRVNGKRYNTITEVLEYIEDEWISEDKETIIFFGDAEAHRFAPMIYALSQSMGAIGHTAIVCFGYSVSSDFAQNYVLAKYSEDRLQHDLLRTILDLDFEMNERFGNHDDSN